MSARHQPDSPAMTFKGWAVCISVSWFTMQIVDLAFRVLS